MKLFAPAEIKSKKDAEERLAAIRSGELLDLAQKSRQHLNETEKQFSETLEANKLEWEEENRKYREEKEKLSAEIKTLQAAREEALKPIDKLRLEIEKAAKELDRESGNARLRESEAEELKARLLQKIEKLTEREEIVKDAENDLSFKILSVKEQTRLMEERRKQLNEEVKEFLDKRAVAVKSLNQREVNLILRERSVEAAQAAILQKENETADEKIRLEDERRTLERAMKRLDGPET